MFIDVKRSSTAPCVAPSGTQEALCRITVGSNCVTTTVSYAGTCQEIRLTGSANADNYSFLKITLLEEILKLGFKLTSISRIILVYYCKCCNLIGYSIG